MNHTTSETFAGSPVFSVIMPCYNSAGYVRAAVASILQQTYPYWELVAINDGSTDNTLEILEEFSAGDPRIRVWSKENGGYVSAVNLGLEKITGDYFLMMGSDDGLDETLFAELSRYAGMDCIAFRTILVEGGQKLGAESITNFSGEATQNETTLAEFSREYPAHAEIFSARDTSKCYKRSLLGDLRYFGRYGFDADGIFSMLLCHRARSFAAIAVDGYYWTLRGDSLSARKSFFAQDLDRVEIWCQFYARILQLEASHITKTEREFLYYFLSITESTWNACPNLENLSLIQQAVGLIRAVSEKAGFPLSLPAPTRLLLRSPAAWKMTKPLWGPVYQRRNCK